MTHQLRQQLANVENTVRFLTNDVSKQQQNAERLKQSLDVTRDLLEKTIIEYKSRLSIQEELIHNQGILVAVKKIRSFVD